MLYVFPAAGVLGALALIALKQYEYFILSIYLILPLIGMPFLYLIVRGRTETGMGGGSDSSSSSSAGYLLMFAFSLVLLDVFDTRPIAYYGGRGHGDDRLRPDLPVADHPGPQRRHPPPDHPPACSICAGASLSSTSCTSAGRTSWSIPTTRRAWSSWAT